MSTTDFESGQKQLQRESHIVKILIEFMTIAMIIVWLMPLSGIEYVFSNKFFSGNGSPWVSFGYSAASVL